MSPNRNGYTRNHYTDCNRYSESVMVTVNMLFFRKILRMKDFVSEPNSGKKVLLRMLHAHQANIYERTLLVDVTHRLSHFLLPLLCLHCSNTFPLYCLSNSFYVFFQQFVRCVVSTFLSFCVVPKFFPLYCLSISFPLYCANNISTVMS